MAPAVEAVARDFRTYEQGTEQAGSRFRVTTELSAARALSTQLDLAVARLQRADEAFGCALTAVYQDPVDARRRVAQAATERGPDDALRTLRDRPERFGELAAGVKRRAFGLIEERDTRAARGAALDASARATEALAVGRDVAVRTLDARAGRTDEVLRDALRTLYRDGDRAKSAFERAAVEHGLRLTCDELCAAPRDVLTPLTEAERHFVVTVDAPDRDAPGVRLIFAVPLAGAAGPAAREVLWWLAGDGDAWAVERSGGAATAWAAMYGYAPVDAAAERLFAAHARQAAALQQLLGPTAYGRLLALYDAELAGSTIRR